MHQNGQNQLIKVRIASSRFSRRELFSKLGGRIFDEEVESAADYKQDIAIDHR